MGPTDSSTAPTRVTLTDQRLFREACYIDGAWVGARSGATISVDDPATGAVIGAVPRLGAAETREAIDAAARAFPAWRRKTAKARAAVLRRWFELVLDNQEDLARLMTMEQGKPLVESRAEVVYGASFLEWFGEEAKRVYGDTIPGHQADKRIVVIKEPIGVAACITPWNFPIAMITRKAAPAIASGCTVVLKPASQTPFSALALAELAERAGLPEGRVQRGDRLGVRDWRGADVESDGPQAVVHGFDRGRQGADGAVRGHDEEAVARARRQRAVHRVRRCGSGCRGGRRDCVEVPQQRTDVRVREPLPRAGPRLRRVRGEACRSREEAEAGARPRSRTRRRDRSSTIAPSRKWSSTSTTRSPKGARLVAGGHRHALGGRFFEPTVLTDVTPEMNIAREETFGPVAPLFRFTSEDEAIRLANDTEFGLAAYFYGRDVARVWRVAEALEYGIVGINTGLISTEVAPFGGMKESGLGREGSKYGIEEYLEIKYLCLGGI